MLATFLIILAVLAAELVTSFVLFPLKLGKSYYAVRINHIVYQYHSVIGYVLKPKIRYSNPTQPPRDAPRKIHFVDVRTNHNGFLTPIKLEALPQDQKLIFCIGGSTTAGFESHHDNTYPAILDSLLEPKGYRCINAGVGGYRSIHELLFFKEKILGHSPSAVIMFSGFNDFEAHCYRVSKPYDPFRHYLTHELPKTRIDKLIWFSALLYLLRVKFFIRLKQKREQSGRFADFISNTFEALRADRSWLDEWKTNVTKLIELCQDKDIRFYLISHITPIYPNASPQAKEYADHDLDMKGQFDAFAQFHHLLRQESIELCRDKKVTFLDIASDFDNQCRKYSGVDYYGHRFSWFVDRVHFTEKGNELVARFVFERLEKTL